MEIPNFKVIDAIASISKPIKSIVEINGDKICLFQELLDSNKTCRCGSNLRTILGIEVLHPKSSQKLVIPEKWPKSNVFSTRPVLMCRSGKRRLRPSLLKILGWWMRMLKQHKISTFTRNNTRLKIFFLNLLVLNIFAKTEFSVWGVTRTHKIINMQILCGLFLKLGGLI